MARWLPEAEGISEAEARENCYSTPEVEKYLFYVILLFGRWFKICFYSLQTKEPKEDISEAVGTWSRASSLHFLFISRCTVRELWGFEPLPGSAMPVQCSTSWAIGPFSLLLSRVKTLQWSNTFIAIRISNTWKFLYYYHLYVYRFIFKWSNKLWGQVNFSTFLLMAFTSQQSLINPMNLRDIRLVMSVLFVLARIHSLIQKTEKVSSMI